MSTVGALPYLLENLITKLPQAAEEAVTNFVRYLRDIYFMVSDASFNSDASTRWVDEAERQSQTDERTERGDTQHPAQHIYRILRIH